MVMIAAEKIPTPGKRMVPVHCPGGCGRMFFRVEDVSLERTYVVYCRSAQCKRQYRFTLSGTGPPKLIPDRVH